jgi:hypothetical protein
VELRSFGELRRVEVRWDSWRSAIVQLLSDSPGCSWKIVRSGSGTNSSGSKVVGQLGSSCVSI